MSYQYSWWPYVKGMIRLYPDRMHYYHRIGEIERKEADAVTAAIRQARQRPDGADRIKLITAMYWKRRKNTITAAANSVPVSRATASRWNTDFIFSVAEEFGLWKQE